MGFPWLASTVHRLNSNRTLRSSPPKRPFFGTRRVRSPTESSGTSKATIVSFRIPGWSSDTIRSLLARLCALVPPPGFHHVRYYGVLASRHALRRSVAPGSNRQHPPMQLALFVRRGDHELPAVTGRLHDGQLDDRPPNRLSWMTLLARVFRVDVSVCGRCGGPMRVVRAVTDPDAIATHLHGARAPPRPAPPGQTNLFAA